MAQFLIPHQFQPQFRFPPVSHRLTHNTMYVFRLLLAFLPPFPDYSLAEIASVTFEWPTTGYFLQALQITTPYTSRSGSPGRQEFAWMFVKFLAAVFRTKVVFVTLEGGDHRCFAEIHFHFADRIDCSPGSLCPPCDYDLAFAYYFRRVRLVVMAIRASHRFPSSYLFQPSQITTTYAIMPAVSFVVW